MQKSMNCKKQNPLVCFMQNPMNCIKQKPLICFMQNPITAKSRNRSYYFV